MNNCPERTYADLAFIFCPEIRDLVRTNMAKTDSSNKRMREHVVPDKYVLGALYFAGKLCRHYNVLGNDRDAVLAALLLMKVEVNMEAVKEFAGDSIPSLGIIVKCIATLQSKTDSRIFPEDFSIHEQITLIAVTISAEKIVNTMGYIDNQMEFDIAA
jgi:hypothetical protein